MIQSVQHCAYVKLSSIDKNVESLEFPSMSNELNVIINELSNVIDNVPFSKGLKGLRAVTYSG